MRTVKKPITREQVELLRQYRIAPPPSSLVAGNIIRFLQQGNHPAARATALRTLQRKFLGKRVQLTCYPNRPEGVIEYISPRLGKTVRMGTRVVTRTDRYSARSVPFNASVTLDDGSWRVVSLDWLKLSAAQPAQEQERIFCHV